MSGSLASINVKFLADLKSFSTSMQNAQRQLQRTGKKMQSLGKNMSLGVTAPLTAVGALSFKTFANLEQELAKVQAVSGATGAQFEMLRKNAEELGRTTRFTATQVAGLQLNYSKLGFKPDEIAAATGATLDLALATGEDLANSATVAASTLRGFGLDVGEITRVTDVMAKSFSSSALDLSKFETAMGVVAPVAKGAGVSIEQATAQLSVLVDAGIDASTAGTALRNIFLDLSKSGMTYEQALNEINSAADSNVVALDLFGKRGATVASVLADNVDKANELTVAYGDAAGSAAAMAKIMDNTANGAMLRLQSSIEGMGIEIGKILAPFIARLADLVAGLATRFSNLSTTTKQIIIAVAAFAAAIGPIVLALGTLITMAPALGAAFTLLTGPIGLVIAALAGVAFVVYKYWDDIMIQVQRLRNYFTDLYNESVIFRASVEIIAQIFRDVMDIGLFAMQALFAGIEMTARAIVDLFTNVGAAVKAVLTGNFDVLGTIFEKNLVEQAGQFKRFVNQVGKDFTDLQSRLASNEATMLDAVTRKKLSIEVDVPDVTGKLDELQKIIDNYTPAGGGGASGKALVKPVQLTADQLQPNSDFTLIDPDQEDAYNEQLLRMQMNAVQFSESIGPIMEGAAQSFAVGFGQLIGNAATGGNFIQGFAQLFVGTMADMAIQVGKTAIGIGLAVEGIRKALETLNPVVAVAAGVALVALGTIAKNVLGNIAGGGETPFANGGIVYGPTRALVGEYAGARNNPEVIAPLNKLQNLIEPVAGSGPVSVNLGGEFILKGSDLVQVVERVNKRNKRIK